MKIFHYYSKNLLKSRVVMLQKSYQESLQMCRAFKIVTWSYKRLISIILNFSIIRFFLDFILNSNRIMEIFYKK